MKKSLEERENGMRGIVKAAVKVHPHGISLVRSMNIGCLLALFERCSLTPKQQMSVLRKMRDAKEIDIHPYICRSTGRKTLILSKVGAKLK